MLNAGITPCVPEFGSLGCSGDLAPLAHCALARWAKARCDATRRAARRRGARGRGSRPVVLEEKEGLALINGTDGMLGMLVLALADSTRW
jgi:histidine ammonia-lyase